MGQELEKVKSGYAKLDVYNKLILKDFITEFDNKTSTEQKAINERFASEVRNKSLGPTSSSNCPCCGS